jgi:hypothetical protein
MGSTASLVVGLAVMVAGVLAAPSPAAARERPQVALFIDDCVAAPADQVRHLLSLELGGPLSDGETPPGATRAAVTCPPGPLPPEEGAPPAGDKGDLVELRVDDGVTGKSVWRSVELHQADPAVRARLLSIALAELIFASWAELLVTPQPTVPAAAPSASAATRQATSVQVERKLPQPLPPLGIQLSALGAAYVLWQQPSVSFGGGLRLLGEHRYHLGWDLDVLAEHGESATNLGMIHRDLFSAGAALLVHHRIPHLILRGGAGARFGAARLSGEPSSPQLSTATTLWGPFGGPLLTAGVSAAAARVRLDLGLEAGYVVTPVIARAGGMRADAVAGPWLGVQLGLGVFLR